MTTPDTILPYIAIAVSCVLIALSALSIGLIRLVHHWRTEAERYKKLLRDADENIEEMTLFRNLRATDKFLRDINDRQEALASVAPEKAAEDIKPTGDAKNINWTRQDRYRLKMERNGFVRVVDERGRTRYTKVEKTAWIKSTKQWIRVSRDSKLFKEASFFFPGDYEKPTKNNYWQLLNRVHQDIEKIEGSGK